MMNHAKDHNLISPTAKWVAYYRQFSDLPFAREIAEATDAEATIQQAFASSNLASVWRTGPIFTEARYKSIAAAIQKLGITQVLEFACGLSFRSLFMAQNPEMVYVETDLPGMMASREDVITSIPALEEALNGGRIFFHAVNALNYEEIAPALSHFDPQKPIAVVHEGLYMYLTIEEKELLANNIKKILQRFGGAWITPDLATAEERKRWIESGAMVDPSFAAWERVIETSTGRRLAAQAFRNEDHLFMFFDHLGFDFTETLQIDGSYTLSSLANGQLSDEQFATIRSILKLWILTLSDDE